MAKLEVTRIKLLALLMTMGGAFGYLLAGARTLRAQSPPPCDPNVTCCYAGQSYSTGACNNTQQCSCDSQSDPPKCRWSPPYAC